MYSKKRETVFHDRSTKDIRSSCIVFFLYSSIVVFCPISFNICSFYWLHSVRHENSLPALCTPHSSEQRHQSSQSVAVNCSFSVCLLHSRKASMAFTLNEVSLESWLRLMLTSVKVLLTWFASSARSNGCCGYKELLLTLQWILMKRFGCSQDISVTVKHIHSHTASTCWFLCSPVASIESNHVTLKISSASYRELIYI